MNNKKDQTKECDKTSTDVDNVIDSARIPYGSRKEFQYGVLLENWGKSNGELSSILGVTPGSVSRLRTKMLSSPDFVARVLDIHYRNMADEDISKELKADWNEKLLRKLVDKDLIKLDASPVELLGEVSRRVEDACKQYDKVFASKSLVKDVSVEVVKE